MLRSKYFKTSSRIKIKEEKTKNTKGKTVFIFIGDALRF